MAFRSAVPLLLGLLLVLPIGPVTRADASAACLPEDCLPVVPIPDVPYLSGSVRFEQMTVDVAVQDALARTDLALTLSNPGPEARQATLAIPLPDGASLLAFNLSWPGHRLEGVVLERGQAIQTYEEAQQQGLDAALLEEAGRHLVRLRVNVGAGEARTLAAAYVEPVPLAQGARVYRFPLGQLDPAPDRLDVAVAVRSSLGVLDLHAPRLAIPLASGAGHVGLDGPEDLDDLVLVWQEEGARRSFLVAASDPAGGPTSYWGSICVSGTVLHRDVVFILDQSGSMGGLKIQEGRQTLAAALESVGPDDRYSIVLFSDEARPFSPSLVAGDAAHVAADSKKALAVEALGGTNLDAALVESFRQLNAAESARLPMVVLLTDGLPTVGVTDHQAIITNAKAANLRHAAVHVVPIGLDADYTFLADLALGSGGAYVDVGAPDAALSDHLGRLTQVLSQPVVRDPVLTVTGLDDLQVLPRTLPALFADGCLDVRMTGRATGPITLRMDGMGADGSLQTTASFALQDIPVEPAVRALWGQALVADLLAQERAHPSEALRAAIIANATALSQLTPYTAWVLADAAPAQEASGEGSQGSATASSSGPATGAASSSRAGIAAPSGTAPAYDSGGSSSAKQKTPGPGLPFLALALAGAAFAARRRR